MAKSKSNMVRRGNYYYKYICIWNNETKTKSQVPIKLAHIDQYELALDRKGVVENLAKQFKRAGKLHKIRDYQFDWMSESGKAEFKKPLTFVEGYDKFIEKRKVAKTTMCMNLNSLNHWLNHLSPTIFCKDIEVKHLIGFVSEHKHTRSDTSINWDLRTIRTMLFFLKDMGEINEVPSFKRSLKMCPINDQDPIYVSEVEFIEIMSTDWMLLYPTKRDWYKEVFELYWDLGVRLQEPFFSTIRGNYLCIPKDMAKNRFARNVRITQEQALTIQEMQRIYKQKPTIDHIKNYSKVFKKALRHCDIDESKHFHSLRHSYALRRRLETNGNYQSVAKEMGHKRSEVTEKYQRCDERKLMDDFPSYKAIIESLQNGVISTTSTMDSSTRSYYRPHYSLRQMN